MLKPASLDDLLDNQEPHATFHDAAFKSIAVDDVAHRLVAQVELCVGDPGDADAVKRERRRLGTLTVEGVVLWAVEPGLTSGDALWLTSDGPLNTAPTQAGQTFAAKCGACNIAWFLFFSDLNAFGYVAADCATFHWT